MMNILRAICLRAILIMFGLVIALAVTEIAVRALNLYQFPAEGFFAPHPELGWSHVSNREGYYTIEGDRIPVKINSKGLRDREYGYEKEKGTFRILVLGDSFVEAFQVRQEQSFPKLLESRLNQRGGHFEVINGGLGGVGTDYELLFFKREGRKYSPDLVLLAFFANDVYDNYRSRRPPDDKEVHVYYEQRSLVFRIRQFLAQHSHAYNYFGVVLPKCIPALANVLMKLGLLAYQPVGDAKGVTQLHWMVLSEEEIPQWQEAWEVTKTLILQIRNECAAVNCRFAVVSIPFKEQVYDDAWKRASSEPGMRGRKWDLTRPDRILTEFLADEDIPFLPLLPSFRQSASTSQLYFSLDGHWNAEGHRLAQKLIFEWLRAEQLVPVEVSR